MRCNTCSTTLPRVVDVVCADFIYYLRHVDAAHLAETCRALRGAHISLIICEKSLWFPTLVSDAFVQSVLLHARDEITTIWRVADRSRTNR